MINLHRLLSRALSFPLSDLPLTVPPPLGIWVATDGSDTAGTGTFAAPYKTIGKADSVAAPGDNIYVKAGTYAGDITTTAAGTAGNPIRFISYPKWGAKITHGATTGAAECAWEMQGDYSQAEGFEVDGGDGSLWRLGFYVTSSFTKVLGNHIHHVAALMPCDATGGGAIVLEGFYADVGQEANGNWIHHIGPAGCTVYHGVYVQSHGPKIKNNLVHNIAGDGIVGYHDGTFMDIINNTCFACQRGIVTSAGGFYNETVSDFNNVHNNLCYANIFKGMVQANVPEAGDNCTCKNNLVVGNGDGNFYARAETETSGNILTGAPGFANYQADGSGDYHITAGSQGVNAGLADLAPADDFDGFLRVGAPDIGCFEFH